VLAAGVDYLHPDLGGGFGPGYRVIAGYDFVGDEGPCQRRRTVDFTVRFWIMIWNRNSGQGHGESCRRADGSLASR